MSSDRTLHQHLRNLLFLVALVAFFFSAGIVGWLQFQADLDGVCPGDEVPASGHQGADSGQDSSVQ